MTICLSHHDGHHYSDWEEFEEHISRGRCKCGAVRYAVSEMVLKVTRGGQGIDFDLLARVAKLNEQEELKKMSFETAVPQQIAISKMNGRPIVVADIGGMVSLPLPIPPKPANRRELIDYYEANEEQIRKELKAFGQQATMKRWGINTARMVRLKEAWGLEIKRHSSKVAHPLVKGDDLLLVPPRPDVTGLSRGAAATVTAKYHSDNLPAIAADLKAHDELYVLLRWKIPLSTWSKGLCHRVDPEKYGPRPKRAAKKKPPVAAMPSNDKPPFPAYPAFSECKDGAAQVQWLIVWRDLAVRAEEK